MISMPRINYLKASRSIRVAWLLEELGLEYEVKFADRESQKAPKWLKDAVGGLGKLPVLQDGDLKIYESGNITEYLCDKYDKQNRLLPPVGDTNRYTVLQWVHASEATFMGHALSILYARWFQKGGDVAATEEGLSGNVRNDLDYFSSNLDKSSGKFLLGDSPTAADIMMEFSVDFILARELGTKGKSWPRINQFLTDAHATATWTKAQQKTGHKL